MRLSLLAPALCLALALPARSGRVLTDSVASAALGATVRYNVYLPTGYNPDGGPYPVVYLLHGLSDDYRAWADKGTVQPLADQLVESGECRPLVIIMPNAGGPDVRHTPCGYFNMPGWSYEDFFFGELLPEAEGKYRAGGRKSLRAVMGLSMGGGGSVAYCQRHPDMFSSCYAMSAWLDNEGNPVDEGKEQDWLHRTGESVREHSALRFVRESDDAAKARLRTVRWFLDCGDDDFLLDLSVGLHRLMRAAGVKCELRVRDGIHNWEYWHQSLRAALPFASREFGR